MRVRRHKAMLLGAVFTAMELFGAMGASRAAQPIDASRRPNVLVIVADDMGYGDPSSYGAPYATPNMDALAQDGVRFTNAYVTAAVCSPSRAGLMTGRYQQRFGHEYQLFSEEQNREFGVDPGQPTIAKSLAAAGYTTALFGKWHLGLAPQRNPLKMGFQTFYGFLGGRRPYVDDWDGNVGLEYPDRNKMPELYQLSDNTQMYDNSKKTELASYLTDELTDKAVSYIDTHNKKPFLLMVTYSAPHWPLQATNAQLKLEAGVADPDERIYRTVINQEDIGIGRIRETLKKNGLTDNTLIIFLSDNGCPKYISQLCSNRPLNGWKRYLMEGGIRIPFIVAWPTKIAKGQTFDGITSSLDIYATAVAAAGAKSDPKQPPDGVNLLPYLEGKAQGNPHDRLYWRSLPSYAIRDGNWKLLGNGGENGDEVTMLFDLQADPGEVHDVSAEHPDVVSRLNAEWKAWSATLAPAGWPSDRVFDVTIDGKAMKITD
ncbi:MAG TPA: sulfatase-like hydrolase/transferase [Rhizomicrobium sp.]|nr:sulfatase-like hydrolase/transferase [Rhizomicrobium sp.]